MQSIDRGRAMVGKIRRLSNQIISEIMKTINVIESVSPDLTDTRQIKGVVSNYVQIF